MPVIVHALRAGGAAPLPLALADLGLLEPAGRDQERAGVVVRMPAQPALCQHITTPFTHAQ